MPSSSPTPLATLLHELEVAVDGGARPRALQLARMLFQRLADPGIPDPAGLERRIRALLAALDAPELRLDPVSLEAIRTVRGADPVKADGFDYPVWFGTNRTPAGGTFTNEPNTQTTHGRVMVHVPEAHRFGETGTSFWRRLLRRDLRDDHLRIRSVEARQRDGFFAGVQAEMQAARDSGGPAQALVFLHGYNTSFEDAAIRAAQIGVDLKVPGATAFFSWPSRGALAGYPADEAAIEDSEPAITDFLLDLTAHSGAEKVHIIAHSMGNRGLLRALQRIAGRVKFGQIFLAAPDVSRTHFLNLAHLYAEHSERTTLYASNADRAVHLSAVIHDAPRAGYFKPYTVTDGVDTVAVPNFDVDWLGHGYFAQAEGLLYDIHALMRHGDEPARRQRITLDYDDGTPFWKLRR